VLQTFETLPHGWSFVSGFLVVVATANPNLAVDINDNKRLEATKDAQVELALRRSISRKHLGSKD
jgi:hypothetical protein